MKIVVIHENENERIIFDKINFSNSDNGCDESSCVVKFGFRGIETNPNVEIRKYMPETINEISDKCNKAFRKDENASDCKCNCKTEKKYLTHDEAMKAVLSGKKVSRAKWKLTKPEIIYIAEKNNAICQFCKCGCCGFCVFVKEDEEATDWYIVE